MNLKRLALAAVGAFVVIFATEFVLHHLCLGEFYKAHAAWWRPEAQMQSMMHLMFLAQAVLAVLLPVVYAKGYEAGKNGLLQGLRFGLLMGLVGMVPYSLSNYVVYPYPSSLIISWFVGGMVEFLLAGLVIGVLYQPRSSGPVKSVRSS